MWSLIAARRFRSTKSGAWRPCSVRPRRLSKTFSRLPYGSSMSAVMAHLPIVASDVPSANELEQRLVDRMLNFSCEQVCGAVNRSPCAPRTGIPAAARPSIAASRTVAACLSERFMVHMAVLRLGDGGPAAICFMSKPAPDLWSSAGCRSEHVADADVHDALGMGR